VDVNLAEDLVPLSDLGAGSTHVRDVLHTGRPKVVTEHGVGVAVIVDVETYEGLRAAADAQALRRDLDAALAEADAGDLIDHHDVMAEVRGKKR
jgi:antitoxin YefM